jgi:Domain of unknown function (DUF4203)
MLPHSYELPAAVLLVLGGALSCFAGYRLFKIVLAIYGFILGASIASSTMGVSNATGQVLAAIVGGLAGALILVLAYFVGIALIGAGLGALVSHVAWGYFGSGDPPAALVIVLAIFGAIGAMLLQRYVIIVATAFGGAWTVIVGALAIAAGRVPAAANTRNADVWILYPMSPAPDQKWVPIAWIALGLVGTAVQLGITARKK